MPKTRTEEQKLAEVRIEFPETEFSAVLTAGRECDPPFDVSQMEAARSAKNGRQQINFLKSFTSSLRPIIDSERNARGGEMKPATKHLLSQLSSFFLRIMLVHTNRVLHRDLVNILAYLPEECCADGITAVLVPALQEDTIDNIVNVSWFCRVPAVRSSWQSRYGEIMLFVLKGIRLLLPEDDPEDGGEFRSRVSHSRNNRAKGKGIQEDPRQRAAITRRSRIIIELGGRPSQSTVDDSSSAGSNLGVLVRCLSEVLIPEIDFKAHGELIPDLAQTLADVVQNRKIHKDTAFCAAVCLVGLIPQRFPSPSVHEASPEAVVQLAFLCGLPVHASILSAPPKDSLPWLFAPYCGDGGEIAYSSINVAAASDCTQISLLNAVIGCRSAALVAPLGDHILDTSFSAEEDNSAKKKSTATDKKEHHESLLFWRVCSRLCDITEGGTDPFMTSNSLAALRVCLETMIDILSANAAKKFIPLEEAKQPAEDSSSSTTNPSAAAATTTTVTDDVRAVEELAAESGSTRTKRRERGEFNPLVTHPLPIPMLLEAFNRCIDAAWLHTEHLPELAVTLFQTAIYFRSVILTIERQQPGADLDNLAPHVAFYALAQRVISLPHHRRSKCKLLMPLLEKVGADNLLKIEPKLIQILLQSTRDTTVGSSIAVLLEAVVSAATDELAEDDSWWARPIAESLVNADFKMRHCMSVFILPKLIQKDNSRAPTILSYVLTISKETNAASSLIAGEETLKKNAGVLFGSVAIMSATRTAGLPIDALDGETYSLDCANATTSRLAARTRVAAAAAAAAAVTGMKTEEEEQAAAAAEKEKEKEQEEEAEAVSNRHLAIDHVRAALLHADDSLRLSALELVCCNPRMRQPLSSIELELVEEFLACNFKSSSSDYRHKSMEFLKRFCLRARVSSLAAIKHAAKLRKPTEEDVATANMARDRTHQLLARICTSCASSLYPGAAFERIIMAIELFLVIADVWVVSPAEGNRRDVEYNVQAPPEEDAFAKSLIFSKDILRGLIKAVLDSFDYVRHLAYTALQLFPTPLVGFEEDEAGQQMIVAAKALLDTHRVREADCGALLLRLVHMKDMHLSLDELKALKTENSSLAFLWTIVRSVEETVKRAREDFSATMSSSFVHGKLLAIRYLLPDVDIPSRFKTPEDRALAEKWREFFLHLTQVLESVTDTALQAMGGIAPERVGYKGPKQPMKDPLSQPRDFLNVSPNEVKAVLEATRRNLQAEGQGLLDQDDDEADLRGGGGGQEDGEENDGGDDEEEEEGDESDDKLGPREQLLVVSCWLSIKEAALLLGAMASHVPQGDADFDYFTVDALKGVGQHLLRVLLTTLHNGAIEKSRRGLQAVAHRLLCSSNPELRALPMEWLHDLLSRMNSIDTGLVVIRRSGQLAFSILALLLAEPKNTMHTLIPVAMAQLTKTVVDTSLPVRPRVHALNCLRALFLNTDLAHDLVPYIQTVLQIALIGFESPSWAIRNSSTLCFSALLNRSLGGSYESTIQKIFSPKDFFLRYPTLLPLLLDRLGTAVVQLESKERVLHPILQPSLLILASLGTPSHEVSTDNQKEEAIGWLAFIPLLRRCAASSDAFVRQMSARGLVSLIPRPSAQKAMQELLEQMPTKGPIDNSNQVHGLLLQFQMMWEAHAKVEDEAAGSKWADIIAQLALRVEGLGGDLQVAPVIRACLLRQSRVCLIFQRRLQSSSKEQGDAATQLLLAAAEVAVPCVATVVASNPFSFVLSATAARLLTLIHLEKAPYGPEAAVQSILSLLTHPVYDVRRGVLRQIKYVTKDSAIHPDVDVFSLVGSILSLIWKETHLGCQRKLISIVTAALANGSFSLRNFSHSEAVQLASKLAELYEAPPRCDRRQGKSLLLMGHVISYILASHAGGESQKEKTVFDAWMLVLRLAAHPDKPEPLRYYAAESLAASTALTVPLTKDSSHPALHDVMLHVWEMALFCLQDDSDDVRNVTAVTVSRALSSLMQQRKEQTGDEKKLIDVPVEVQEAKAIEMAFSYLSLHFGGDKRWINALWRAIDPENGGFRVEMLVNADEAASTRRMFEKDSENFQEEKLLIVQLSALHLRLLTCGNNPKFVWEERKALFEKSLERLVVALKAISERTGITWIGGVTDNSEVFQEMSRLMLACLALQDPSQPASDELKSLWTNLPPTFHPLLKVLLSPLVDPETTDFRRLFFLLSPSSSA